MKFGSKTKIIREMTKWGILSLFLFSVFAPNISLAQLADCPPGSTRTQSTDGSGQYVCKSSTGEETAISPERAAAQNPKLTKSITSFVLDDVLGTILTPILGIVAKIVSLGVALSGWALDGVIEYTITDMSVRLGPQGLGPTISDVWGTIRDMANIVFIFILLYAAFKTMFEVNLGGDLGKTIKNIIIVALLINFSLFFTKVVIDASNIVAQGFYSSITEIGNDTTSTAGGVINTSTDGISAGYMKLLGLQTWNNSSVLDPSGQAIEDNIILVYTLQVVFMIVIIIVFLIATIMFITRYILLVFLLILSPLAFIAAILPGQSSHFQTWYKSVINQAFFAPVFFALTWVTFKIAGSENFLGTNQVAGSFAGVATDPKSAMGLIINYLIVIGFSIATLVLSKSMASKSAGFGAVSAGVGGAVFGGTAMAGRQTLGRFADRAAKSATFQQWAAKNPKTVGNLYSGVQKAAKGGFDVRGVESIKKIPGLGDQMSSLGKSGGDGGFAKFKDDKTKSIIEKGKSFTDKKARVIFAEKKASGLFTKSGSTNNKRSLFGMIGGSNRIAAATLFDERIKELGAEMGKVRGEINTYIRGIGRPNDKIPDIITAIGTSTTPVTPPTSPYDTLKPYELDRLRTIVSNDTVNGSFDNMNKELTDLKLDRDGLDLKNTIRQQF